MDMLVDQAGTRGYQASKAFEQYPKLECVSLTCLDGRFYQEGVLSRQPALILPPVPFLNLYGFPMVPSVLYIQMYEDRNGDIMLSTKRSGDGLNIEFKLTCGLEYPLQILQNGKDKAIVTTYKQLDQSEGPTESISSLPVHEPIAMMVTFKSEEQVKKLLLLTDKLLSKEGNTFDKKFDRGSSDQYFHYYGMLSQQQNMLQDAVRTGGYFWAIRDNASDFKGKVVMDVGAGTGILAIFAAMAGASCVYAVEASGMAQYCKILLQNGNPQFLSVIKVIQKKVEEIEEDLQVDVLVSEPMGTLLVNERMLESYIYARNKFLKPGGKMFPTTGTIRMAGYQDDYLQQEILQKSLFWGNPNYYGVNLQPLYQDACAANFKQVVVDAIDAGMLITDVWSHTIDFTTVQEHELYSFQIPIQATTNRAYATLHGVAAWFDVLFDGSTAPKTLSTAPGLATTHWFQMRLPLQFPIQAIPLGSEVGGHLNLVANSRQSYDMRCHVKVCAGQSNEQDGMAAWPAGPQQLEAKGCYDLKDPYYRSVLSWSQAHVPHTSLQQQDAHCLPNGTSATPVKPEQNGGTYAPMDTGAGATGDQGQDTCEGHVGGGVGNGNNELTAAPIIHRALDAIHKYQSSRSGSEGSPQPNAVTDSGPSNGAPNAGAAAINSSKQEGGQLMDGSIQTRGMVNGNNGSVMLSNGNGAVQVVGS